ncbi:MAG TPA: hypothetical protein VLH61_03590 [Bacteroidales bacterium]|nr:hypothetical protein [Bacteroidales bacterium]
MKSLSVIKVLGIGLVMSGLLACEKDADQIEIQTQMAEDEAIAEAYFSQVIYEANNAWATNIPSEGVEPGVNVESETTITQQTGAPVTSGERIVTIRRITGQSPHPGYPLEVTINFRNWQVGQGPVSNGTIIIIVTGPLHLHGTSITITSQNFNIDGNVVQGTKTITNVNGLTFNITLVGGKITFTDGTTITRELTRTWTWAGGIGTPNFIWDDEFSITGTTAGTNRRDAAYSLAITKPLIHKMSCLWLVEGTVSIQHGENAMVLDYGNGTCDNLATIIFNGETREITLPRTPPARKR